MDFAEKQDISNRDLSERVEKLEDTVREVCYTLYELIEHLRGMKSTEQMTAQLVALPPPTCPPICARPGEEEESY
jgi:hypothetical protein